MAMQRETSIQASEMQMKKLLCSGSLMVAFVKDLVSSVPELNYCP